MEIKDKKRLAIYSVAGLLALGILFYGGLKMAYYGNLTRGSHYYSPVNQFEHFRSDRDFDRGQSRFDGKRNSRMDQRAGCDGDCSGPGTGLGSGSGAGLGQGNGLQDGSGAGLGGGNLIEGKIISKDDNSITIQLEDGTNKTISFGENLVIEKIETLGQDNLAVGSSVSVSVGRNINSDLESLTTQRIQVSN